MPVLIRPGPAPFWRWPAIVMLVELTRSSGTFPAGSMNVTVHA